MLISASSPTSKESRSDEPRRKKRNGTTRWQRKCTISESSVSSGGRSATSCFTREQIFLDWLLFVRVFSSDTCLLCDVSIVFNTVMLSPFDPIDGIFFPSMAHLLAFGNGTTIDIPDQRCAHTPADWTPLSMWMF